ncbi:aldolase [Mesorhizobium sp. B2-4-12]|uniref:3-oxo-tetronate 4-phosphate decarboxylase n=1 Tax=Mesorhizobium sp. B2-4-12 TaxID=2589937 RepID=UPI00112E4AF1|nr:3-oxo-tetronate 4-phosphate decarboxylase [Mesorhizobium sp. B2-4-12]TPK93895.1 aldolase [Mesorhizobium sp. B2-4-12]
MSSVVPSRERALSNARDGIMSHAQSLFTRGLTAGSSGNLSVRVEGGYVVTPTNASLGALDPARLSVVDFEGKLVEGDAPSKETVLHLAMYGARPQSVAIVHLHATHSAAVSCMCGLPEDDCLPPLTPYFVMKIGKLPLLRYRRPGDPALAPDIRAAATRGPAVLLANHGPLVSGKSLEAAVYAIEDLEETAKLFLLLRGSETRPLNADQIGELRATFGEP